MQSCSTAQNPSPLQAGAQCAASQKRSSNHAAAEHRPVLQPSLHALPCGELPPQERDDEQANSRALHRSPEGQHRQCQDSGLDGWSPRAKLPVQVSQLQHYTPSIFQQEACIAFLKTSEDGFRTLGLTGGAAELNPESGAVCHVIVPPYHCWGPRMDVQ